MLTPIKKTALVLAVTAYVFVLFFGVFSFRVPRAKAIVTDVNVTFTNWWASQKLSDLKMSTEDKVQMMLLSAAINGVNYFANKIAYDMGVWLASGDFGQGPFTSGKSFGHYMAQVAGDSLGNALGALSRDLGLNLCDLPDLRLDLMLQLGFHYAKDPPKPLCTWQQLKSAYNVENIRSKYASKEALSSRISAGIQVNDTDFGVWFKSKESIDTIAAEQTMGAQLDRQEGEGIESMTDIIAGNQITPATIMRQEFISQSPSEKKDDQQEASLNLSGAAFARGAGSVGLNAISTFVNTLLGTVLNNFISKGMLPGGAKVCNPGLSLTGVGWDQCGGGDTADSLTASYYSTGEGAGQRRAAQELFSEFLKPAIKTLENYDPIGKLAECSPDNVSPDACVVDQSFIQIIEAAETGDPLTIKQALERGLLHGDWKLYSSDHEAENQNRECALTGYCQRNMQFLRLLRILPLGFEIAASKSDENNPVTLKEAVAGYYDSGSPYYHLINPHWVIKYPKTRCGAYAYSAISTGNGSHLQTCADIQHCVGYNKDGSCSNWGYCLREKPIWKFAADYCSAEYASCRAFTGSNGQLGSYLVRTLDMENCDAENAGCVRYSKYKYNISSTSSDWLAQDVNYNSAFNIFINSSINLNSKAPSCSNNSDGCAAFKLASDSSKTIYLKKAPDYTGCYDADSSTATNPRSLFWKKLANGTQYPATFSDLNLIKPQDPAACANYAGVCLPEEENCNFYTALASGEKIPGKFTPAEVINGQIIWHDQCDASCVGYAAYREMPSNYSRGQDLSYVIPSSGELCSSVDAGCSSFTNLSTNQAGLEQNEYFSYLRLCSLPDQNLQRNYTVYESSEQGGYQIRTFTLLKNESNNGPKQVFRDQEEYNQLSDLCNASVYSLGQADPDCHQFVDNEGAIHYAFLSKTVLASDRCTPYRLNNTELLDYQTNSGVELRCPYDFDPFATDGRAGENVVEFKNNACFYMGFVGNTNGAGDSKSCVKEVESCRAYKGNAGNNIRLVFEDDFESATTSEWISDNVSISVSSESTQINGHSLKISAQTSGDVPVVTKPLISGAKGKSYFISFWMKGDVAMENVNLREAVKNVNAFEASFLSSEIAPSNVWKYHSFGPVEYEGDINKFNLSFVLSSTGGVEKQVYIDNIKLTEAVDYIYLIKNSLSVNLLCDSNPNDNLPGEALGCASYATPNKTTYYLTNFNYLCREAAIGCTALIDTYNTPDDAGPRAYNVWISGAPNSMAVATFDGEKYSCQVPQGESGCYTNIFGVDMSKLDANIKTTLDDSSVYIPADTPSDQPIYLVANKNASCRSEDMGCQTLGKASISAGGISYPTIAKDVDDINHYEVFNEVSVRNDPALYDDILCNANEVGCDTWSSGEAVYYFKNPKLTGKICEYVTDRETFVWGRNLKNDTYYLDPILRMALPTNPLETRNLKTGWFLKDVGVCDNTTRACLEDANCGSDGHCLYKGEIPCYYNSKTSDRVFQLYSYGTEGRYEGFVGECPANQSGCEEFVDWSSSGINKKCAKSGKKCYEDSDCNEIEEDLCTVNTNNAYYLIENDKLVSSQGTCEGKVSQAEGCVLLDKTSNPNKYYNTEATYRASYANDEKPVSPISLESGRIVNDANVIMKVTHDRECGEWAYCDLKQQYEDEETGEVKSRCYHLGVCEQAGNVETAAGIIAKDCAKTVVDWDTKNQELTIDLYRKLINAWDAWDFSGYSIFNTYQVPNISAREINDVYRLVYVSSTLSAFSSSNDPTKCKEPTLTQNFNGDPCGKNQWGRCYNGECLVNFTGASNPAGARRLTCRAYPEETSPFPSSVLMDTKADIGEYKDGFEGANICYTDKGNPTSCDYTAYCSYRKIKTGAGEVYKPVTESVKGSYICATGPKKGKYCSDPESDDCGDGGTCTAISGLQMMPGWMGYCLEYDDRQRINGTDSLACMTWWPIESPPGVPSYWDIDPNAGYAIAEGNENRNVCISSQPILGEGLSGPFASAIFDNKLFVAINVGEDENKFGGLWPPGIDPFPERLPPFSGTDLFDPEDDYVGFSLPPYSIPWDFNENGASTLGPAEVGSVGSFAPITDKWLEKLTGDYYCRLGAERCQWASNDWIDNWETPEKLTDRNHYDFYHYRELDRIDVFLDQANKIPYTGGAISFVRDIVDGENGGNIDDMHVKEYFSDTGGGWSKDTVRNLGDLCNTGGDWHAWEWRASEKEDGDQDWFTIKYDDDGSGTVLDDTKAKLISEGICKNAGYTSNNVNLGGDTMGVGIRVIFDNNGYLRGILSNLVRQSEKKTGSTMGEFAVIRFYQGYCSAFAQISVDEDDADDADTDDFLIKPFTNRLNTDTVGFLYPALVKGRGATYNRTDELNGGKFGMAWDLAEGWTAPEESNRPWPFFVNPFAVYGDWNDSSAHTEPGSMYNNYELYRAGVPLAATLYNVTNPDYNKTTTENPALLNMLKQMFAKIYRVFKSEGTSYNDADYGDGEIDAANPNTAASIGLNIFPPRVAAPDGGSWKLDSISVNNQTSGNIYLISGAQTHIKFYAWAHGNQMPVRRIVVDKGDSHDTQVDTKVSDAIANRKPVCAEKICGSSKQTTDFSSQFACDNADDCKPIGRNFVLNGECLSASGQVEYRTFGNTTDTGCKEAPWDFVVDYNCPFGTSVVIEYNATDDVEINGEKVAVADIGIDWARIRQDYYNAPFVCVNKPRVHVLDNWGWCTGNCAYSNSQVSGNGCYGDDDDDQCDIVKFQPWVDYSGYVIVVPLPES